MGNAMRNSLAIDRRQSGTTLLEVLITVVLVSVGLLGLAGLQLATVQNTNSAGERFEATTLAQDILERMRANRLRALNGEYDLAMLDDPAGDDLVVATDLDNWMAALQTLPQGDTHRAVVPIRVFQKHLQRANRRAGPQCQRLDRLPHFVGQ